MKPNLIGLLKSTLAVLLLSGCDTPRWDEKPQVYIIQPAPAFLSEELALDKARETLGRDGYQVDEWQVLKTDAPKLKAPDGRRDRYFDRFSWNPRAGRVYFQKGKKTRSYDVRLDGDRLTCSVFRGN